MGASKCTLTKAPGIGGLHGKNRGWPSSRNPVKRLQMGLVPRSGRLLPTRTTTVAGLLLPISHNDYFMRTGALRYGNLMVPCFN